MCVDRGGGFYRGGEGERMSNDNKMNSTRVQSDYLCVPSVCIFRKKKKENKKSEHGLCFGRS